MKKHVFAADVVINVTHTQVLFAIDQLLWNRLYHWVLRHRRGLRRVTSCVLMAGLLWQTMFPITALAANEREAKRAREAVLAERREARAEKPAPSPSPLASSATALAQGGVGLVLSQINTPFNGLTGLAYHEAQNKLLAAVNAPNGQPRNLELLSANGAHTAYANVSNLGGDLRLATARDDGNGKSLANFNRGELFFNTPANGVIARLSANGATLQNPWVTLAGEGGYFDKGIEFNDGVFLRVFAVIALIVTAINKTRWLWVFGAICLLIVANHGYGTSSLISQYDVEFGLSGNARFLYGYPLLLVGSLLLASTYFIKPPPSTSPTSQPESSSP